MNNAPLKAVGVQGRISVWFARTSCLELNAYGTVIHQGKHEKNLLLIYSIHLKNFFTILNDY